MREIIYYEATDGALFSTKEACREYENSLKENVISKFRRLIKRESMGIQITKDGSAFAFAGCPDEWWYAVIVLHDKTDYQDLLRYAKMCDRKVTKEIYNKEIVVFIGSGTDDACKYNDFFWLGTVDEMIESYARAILTFGNEENKGDLFMKANIVNKQDIVNLAREYEVNQSDLLETFLCDLLGVSADRLYEILDDKHEGGKTI